MTHGLETLAKLNREAIADAIPTLSEGVKVIAAERKRQIDIERFTPIMDDHQTSSQLANAAACYAMPSIVRHLRVGDSSLFEHLWPFDMVWWKPSPARRIRELAKAGALIAAEIERLQRIEAKSGT